MNGLDIALVVVVIAFALYGAVKGFVRLVLGALALATGIFLGCWYNAPVAGLLSGVITSEPVRRFTALALILIATIAAFTVLVWFITKTLEVVHLRWFDRISGAVAGLALACVLTALLLVPLAAYLPADNAMMNGSALSPYVLKVSSLVTSFVPADLRQRFEDSMERMKDAGTGLLEKGNGKSAKKDASPAPGSKPKDIGATKGAAGATTGDAGAAAAGSGAAGTAAPHDPDGSTGATGPKG
jgi:membrane protein required for colicin V production